MFSNCFSYLYSMKKMLLPVILLFAAAPVLSSCGKYDYTAHLSEIRSDLFCAETDEFQLTLSCVSREYPYVTDGIASTKSDLVEIVLTGAAENYSVFVLGGKQWGGEMSYRNVRDDYFYSQSVSEFPQNSVTLRVEWSDQSREITATSVKSETTLSVENVLSAAIAAEPETVKRMTVNKQFAGEFYVRLLRRDKNYYYVGIIDKNGNTVSLLLDAESGEVLARRTN